MSLKESLFSTVEIGDLSVSIIKKPIKHVYIVILPTGKVCMRVPLRATQPQLTEILQRRLFWIKRRLALWEARNRNKIEAPAPNNHRYFFGQAYPLQIKFNAGVNSVSLADDAIEVQLYGNNPLRAEPVLREWYRVELHRTATPLIAQWAARMKLPVPAFDIKLMRRTWGICFTNRQRIRLNLALAYKPLRCLEYIIVHELVHFWEGPHSKRFYGFMDHFMPDWREVKALLNTR